MTVNLNKLERMLVLTFKNSLRLHFDSILLYHNRSYPSAHFLSLHALEEVGKMHIVGDFIWHSRVNGRYEEEEEHAWLGDTYFHTAKQRKFVSESELPLPRKFVEAVNSGALEATKQNSVYVGFERLRRHLNLKSRIYSPFRFTGEKAMRQITIMNDYFLVFCLGKITEFYIVDNAGIARLLNFGLYKKLRDKWKHRSPSARHLLSRLIRETGAQTTP